MIETRPGSGSFVAAGAAERSREAHDSSPSDLLEARALLEPAVARLAAQRGRPDAECEPLLAAMERAADAATAPAGTTATAASTSGSPRSPATRCCATSPTASPP